MLGESMAQAIALAVRLNDTQVNIVHSSKCPGSREGSSRSNEIAYVEFSQGLANGLFKALIIQSQQSSIYPHRVDHDESG